jgi:hypothetical protein
VLKQRHHQNERIVLLTRVDSVQCTCIDEPERGPRVIPSPPQHDLSQWLATYKAEHDTLLEEDAEFAQWLETEYVILAGGWQY